MSMGVERSGGGAVDMMVRMRPFALTAVFLGAAVAVWFAWRGLERAMYSENPKFNITKVIVNTGLAVDEDKVKKDTGIVEGVNIFSFNAKKTSAEFLQVYKTVADLKIVKTLPSTVEITAEDRKAALRVGTTMNVIGRDGMIMVADAAMIKHWRNVPCLDDVSKPINVVAGGYVSEGRIVLALLIANTHASMDGLPFKIEKIEIGNDVYVVLTTAGSGTPRHILIPWDEITSVESVRRALVMATETLIKPESAGFPYLIVLPTPTPKHPPRVITSTHGLKSNSGN